MKIKFWGVRGSIPSPGPNTIKYGGNTSCVSVHTEDEPYLKIEGSLEENRGESRLIILDGGSGLRELGIDMMKKMQFEGGIPVPLEMWIFFSHVHWDHIQGVPFFEPMFIKGNNIHLYGEKKVKTCLEDTLKGQQQYPNFPISIEEITINGARMDFTDLYAGQNIHIGNSLIVTSTKLSHPDGVFCYKIIEQKSESLKKVVYATDTEHRDVLDPRLLKIAEDADVLIYDAQYTPEEYSGEVGMPKFDWGHSTYKHAVDIAVAAKVKQLILFHHDPKHSDRDIDEIEKAARSYKASKKVDLARGLMMISAAYEGMEINL
jgi:phosphoribosyl 1,2-cyclic phosphodiesterase